MVETKLGLLLTKYTPACIRVVIELVPAAGSSFDEPIGNLATKLDQVANYARSTFGVRTAPVTQPTAQNGGEHEEKLKKAGNARVIAVLEEELSKAEAAGDVAGVERAKVSLDRAKSAIKQAGGGTREG